MSVGVRGSILHGFEFKKVEVLWKCLCKILFKVLTNMFKTGHPTYTIVIWKIFRIYKLKVKLFIILTQNGVKTLL